MQRKCHSQKFFSFGWIIVALCLPSLVCTQSATQDPVEELRKALETPPSDLAARKKELTARIESIKTLDDLRRALRLEWRPEEDKDAVAKADQVLRASVADRFQKEAKRLLKEGTTTKQQATLSMLAAMGPGPVGGTDKKGIVRDLAPELVDLIRRSRSVEIRCAAARALGSIFADPKLFVPTLEGLLAKGNLEERRAAASGLEAMGNGLVEASTMWGSLSVVINRADVVEVGRKLLPAAAKGIGDSDVEVRRLCLRAMQHTAEALGAQAVNFHEYSLRSNDAEERRRMELELAGIPKGMMPLTSALAEQLPRVRPALKDADLTARLAACQVLETTADARLRLLGLYTMVVSSAKRGAAKLPDDPLGPALKNSASAVAEILSDKEVRVRLAALYVLESMEGEAAPAVAAIVKSLQDKDPFVRWGAARALGRMAPHEPQKAVAGLATVLGDLNNDVRITALAALERYGPSAKAAMPALRNAVGHKDHETRALAIRALIAAGQGARPALPELVNALGDTEASIRAAAANAIGKLGQMDESAKKALTKALSDSDADVRLAAAAALLANK